MQGSWWTSGRTLGGWILQQGPCSPWACIRGHTNLSLSYNVTAWVTVQALADERAEQLQNIFPFCVPILASQSSLTQGLLHFFDNPIIQKHLSLSMRTSLKTAKTTQAGMEKAHGKLLMNNIPKGLVFVFWSFVGPLGNIEYPDILMHLDFEIHNTVWEGERSGENSQ